MRERRDQGHVGAGPQGQVVFGLDMGRTHEVDAAGVDHDQARALAQALLHARGNTGCAITDCP